MWSTHFDKSAKGIQWENIDFSVNGVGTFGHINERKNRPWFILHTINKNYLETGHRPTDKPITSRRKQEKNIFDFR